MNLTVKVSGAEGVREYLKAAGRQAPYALSLALNETANAAQDAIRATLSSNFLVRRPDFLRSTIYRKPGEDFATKSKPVACVRVHGDRDFLAKFEEGGSKTATAGAGHNVAIPMPGVRRNKADVITSANRPRSLLFKKGVRRIDLAGKSLIVQDKRKLGDRGARSEILYILKPSVRIRPRLHFHETAGRAISASWPVSVDNGVMNALLSAK